MDNSQHTHIVKYKTFAWVLLILLIFTFSSVAITQLELGVYSVTAALVFASIKSVIVLMYFMHLKFDKKFYAIMMAGIVLLLASVIFVTFLDYLYR
ncbi:cytochrome-c oxidase [Ancylomarina euxinus]|uniref:Cytochrome-c oxidase n=1 Tax=Ancylomarina euxinus TaxID=2283627 RepID=A0A425Y3M6_9BACT|nr:cytochrome C oxidase subunit IV family protein [Ancylomarina euxinus]MCZ4693167.1 cytochrome C oxidase subunit IV family protein [Ancylomarina euxinus]MUP15305.1 cytochrome-c oxidase [Ancylomarina euxinus]RRG22566.1 cytochrome-c oxidase [Ancylomarina euxinus]